MKYWILLLLMGAMLGGCGRPSEDLSFPEIPEASAQASLPEFLEERPRDLSMDNVSMGNVSMGTQIDEGETAYGGQFLVRGSTYAYDRLSEAEKIWYRDMENILGDMASDGELSREGMEQGLTQEDIDPIFQSVMLDHPELFFVDGYSYKGYTEKNRLIGLEFSGNYNVDRETAVRKQEEILAAATEILACAPVGADDYEKVKYVYETLIRRTDYNSEAPDNQNIYSVLVGGLSVCQGYAKATQFLLNRMGIECTLVQGTVRGERHGWNLVKADGDYYYVDTTWGDASYKSAEDGSIAPVREINYDYLCVTTRELLLTHTIDPGMEMPLCTATADNYYVRENAYFSQPDEEHLKDLFERADAQHSYFVTLKCENRECYEEILRKLITENGIFSYYPGEGKSVVYIQNENQFSLTFWMTNE